MFWRPNYGQLSGRIVKWFRPRKLGLVSLYSFIFERGWLKEMSKDMWVAYTSEYEYCLARHKASKY